MGSFIVEAEGPTGLFGVFEDDGETGYLYLYEPDKSRISRHLHVYDRSEFAQGTESDVNVVWSKDAEKCGVTIAGRFYGMFEIGSQRWASAPLKSDGIQDEAWLEGFQYSC